MVSQRPVSRLHALLRTNSLQRHRWFKRKLLQKSNTRLPVRRDDPGGSSYGFPLLFCRKQTYEGGEQQRRGQQPEWHLLLRLLPIPFLFHPDLLSSWQACVFGGLGDLKLACRRRVAAAQFIRDSKSYHNHSCTLLRGCPQFKKTVNQLEKTHFNCQNKKINCPL